MPEVHFFEADGTRHSIEATAVHFDLEPVRNAVDELAFAMKRATVSMKCYFEANDTFRKLLEQHQAYTKLRRQLIAKARGRNWRTAH